MFDPTTIQKIGELVQIAKLASDINGDSADQVVEKSLQAAIKLLELKDSGVAQEDPVS